MPSYEFEGLRPVVSPSAYVHPTATLIGDVVIADACYVGPGASLRGDFGRLEMGVGSNVQDNCTVHSFPGRVVAVSRNAHVGHGAILHGCWIGPNALIGMNAVVMDDSEIGEDCIVGALSFVATGTRTPPGTLWLGSPARERRAISDAERAWKVRGTEAYQDLAARCLTGLRECLPIPTEEANRPRLGGGYVPLKEWRTREVGKVRPEPES